MRQLLRSLPVFAGDLPSFDPERAPATPVPLFTAWLHAAIAAGAREPHAVTLSTVDARGRPDARLLILKDVEEAGWSFASGASSAKGAQLAVTPYAALSAYWPVLGRQVRIRGRAGEVSRQASAEDFAARSASARALALTGRQSQVLHGLDEVGPAVDVQARRLEQEPDLLSGDWVLYRLVPEEVEFWQATPSRRHVRLRYRRDEQSWHRELLWP